MGSVRLLKDHEDSNFKAGSLFDGILIDLGYFITEHKTPSGNWVEIEPFSAGIEICSSEVANGSGRYLSFYKNKLIPELSSDKEFTALPNTKGVIKLAILAKTKAIIAKTTLILRSLRSFGHK